jgi:hypothetical protein
MDRAGHTQRDGLPVFENVRRDFNEFRLGGEVTVAKFHLTVMRRWELYKEDSPESLITAEGEIGRNNNPFYPISLNDYHAINERLDYWVKKLQLSTAYKEIYNNSISLTAYSSHARNFTSSGTWTFRLWLSLDASYSHLHLDTAGGINFFGGSPAATLATGDHSTYMSNIHAGALGLRFAVNKRIDLYAGYSITKDVGDGRSVATGSVNPVTDPAGAVFAAVQTFPLTFRSPMGRVSVNLTEKLRFNVGYQYYGYKEQFELYSVNENYRGNTGYTSLLWAF